MTKLVFKELGYRRLTSPKTLPEVLEYLKETKMDLDVTLDLRGCVFSYLLARILEAVVCKLRELDGEKKLTILHGYSTATRNHLIPYLTKKITIFGLGITTLDELKSTLKDTHKIEFIVKGSDNV